MIQYFQNIENKLNSGKLWELAISMVIGLLLGALVVFSPYLSLPYNLQNFSLVIPFAFGLVIIFNNLERLILFAIAIAIPLNFDVSVIISPFARNEVNIANGRTIVALTELRVSLILMIVIVGYIVWLVERRGINRTPVRFFASITVPTLGLIFVSILSVIQAQDKQLSFFKIALLVELFLIYFYLANHIRTKQDMQFFIVVLIGMMLVESFLMILQWRTGWSFSLPGIDATSSGGRASGTLGPSTVAGQIMVGQLAIVIAMIWFFSSKPGKVFAVVCFVMGSIALISTGTRSAWGSFVVVIFGFVLIGWRTGWVSRRSLFWLFILSLVIGVIFYQPIYNRITADDLGSAASRPKMFRLAWNVISASPSHFFFGVGANNYALIAPAYNTTDVGYLGYTIDSSVHNAYLLVWSETGLIGLLFYISFLIAPLVKTWRHIRSGNRYISILALGFGCSLVALCIQMLVDPFFMRSINIFLWVLIGLIVSLDNLELMPVHPVVNRHI